MARPLSDGKRKAILEAAARVFAERGLADSPTSAISKEAGIAEGSLFTYFKTKDELMNALYREIKSDMATAMLTRFPREAEVRVQIRHIWDNFVNYGIKHPERRIALKQLEVSGKLTEQTRAAGHAPFGEVMEAVQKAIAGGQVRAMPLGFLGAMLEAQVEATIEFMHAHPGSASRFKRQGFELFWGGASGR